MSETFRQRILEAADKALDELPPPENRFERDRWRIISRIVLDAVEPEIRADEKERITQFLTRIAAERDPAGPAPRLQEMGAAAIVAVADLIRNLP